MKHTHTHTDTQKSNKTLKVVSTLQLCYKTIRHLTSSHKDRTEGPIRNVLAYSNDIPEDISTDKPMRHLPM